MMTGRKSRHWCPHDDPLLKRVFLGSRQTRQAISPLDDLDCGPIKQCTNAPGAAIRDESHEWSKELREWPMTT